jgi:hypothetical protein
MMEAELAKIAALNISLGVTKELFAFAYANNNPVNMSDPSGYMALDNDGRGRTSPSRSAFSMDYSKRQNLKNGTTISTIENSLSSALEDVPDYVEAGVIGNRSVRRAISTGLTSDFLIPIKGAKLLRGISKVEKVGLTGAFFAGKAVMGNYQNYIVFKKE